MTRHQVHNFSAKISPIAQNLRIILLRLSRFRRVVPNQLREKQALGFDNFGNPELRRQAGQCFAILTEHSSNVIWDQPNKAEAK